MRASSLHAQGRAFNEPRHDLAYPERVARRARHPGCISFGYFSLGKQRKVTRALDARGKAKGCGNKKIKSQYKKGWIPAFAGMTSGSKSAGLHAAVLQRALRAIRCA